MFDASKSHISAFLTFFSVESYCPLRTFRVTVTKLVMFSILTLIQKPVITVKLYSFLSILSSYARWNSLSCFRIHIERIHRFIHSFRIHTLHYEKNVSSMYSLLLITSNLMNALLQWKLNPIFLIWLMTLS